MDGISRTARYPQGVARMRGSGRRTPIPLPPNFSLRSNPGLTRAEDPVDDSNKTGRPREHPSQVFVTRREESVVIESFAGSRQTNT